ncbi:MAG: hypothetical protein IJP62_12550 [Treponema sp.]|nr:hypothetical protein [Treponema sp.]
MKKELIFTAGISFLLALTSCLTVNAKKPIDPPYTPPKTENVATGEKESLSKVYFSTSNFVRIDGVFDEWKNLEGVHTHEQVYGGLFNPNNADGFFVARTDGENLYIYANVTDDDAGMNTYEVPQAWRGDSVEFFFGTDTSKHNTFKDSDVRVRIIPRSRDDMFAVTVGINDMEVQSDDIKVAVVYNDKGYQVESKFPLSLLNNKSLKNGQNLRIDYQVNDADGGKERTGLLHWNSPNDNTYADPASWGNAKVVSLPE